MVKIRIKNILLIILCLILLTGGLYYTNYNLNKSELQNEDSEKSIYYGVSPENDNKPGAQGKSFNKNIFGSPLMNEKEVKIDDRNFVSWYAELYRNPQRHSGKPFEMTANIFNIEIDGKAVTYAGRYVMTSFQEEKEKQGIILITDKKFDENQWVYIKGTMSTETIHGQIAPVVKVDLIEKTENKGEDFIYGF